MRDDAPSTDGAVIALRDVVFRYRTAPALDGVSFDLARGELLGIIGPNGSGKSTALRLMSGVLQPQAGSVLWRGRPLAAVRRAQLARELAVVPQDTRIEFPFSVTEVVLMGRAPHLGGFAFESARDLDAAVTAMRRTQTLHLAERTIHELSGGERQRVVLARALAQQPQVLLLDEPGAFLDIRHAVEIYDLLRDLRAEGLTIATVLHDLNLAALYCDRLALLQAGRLVCLGPPASVITRTTLAAVYETDVYVDVNAVTGAICVLPLSRPYRAGGGRTV
jgi:ABC-type cobalamin/Fe3+-siderophores transport system ATPase subunit